MKNKTLLNIPIFIIIIIVVIISVLLSMIINHDITQKEIQKNQDEIFCQQLHKGMTLEEVEKILNEYGEYYIHRYEQIGFFQIRITFLDKNINQKIGNNIIYLNFDNETGYIGPQLQYGLDSRGVCLNGLSEK